MSRTLSLSRETLTELTPQQLGDIAGGAITPACPTFESGCRIPTDHCRSILECLSAVMDPCVTASCQCA